MNTGVIQRLNQLLRDFDKRRSFKLFLEKINAPEALMFVDMIDELKNEFSINKIYNLTRDDKLRKRIELFKKLFFDNNSAYELNIDAHDREHFNSTMDDLEHFSINIFDSIYESQKILLSHDILLKFEEYSNRLENLRKSKSLDIVVQQNKRDSSPILPVSRSISQDTSYYNFTKK